MGAGGDTDFNARTYAKYLEDELGEAVVVSNVSGLGGAAGAAELKKAKPQYIIDKLGNAMENVAKRDDYAADIAKAYNKVPLVMSHEDSVEYITEEREMIIKYSHMFE